eukprot:CAMPEP_0176438492 /NCGR_PEP_ID=MMETSP0127-20121128/19318_1 /TAXON_ID=938130 /ORGANISM="Platyophrya macrostoma, Strain WH" /LENGTH=357 /DNA_ID=CAMNT_0017822457 /DNA_START=18 /DNA_END=1091 /DNA_ORIENTATION=-
MESNPLAYFQLSPTKEEQARKFNQLCSEQFSATVPTLEDQSYYTDLYHTTRFLIAREFDSSKSLQMWKNWCKWRVSYRPQNVTYDEIANELKTGKGFHFGEDAKHNAVIVMQMVKSDPNVSDEETLRFGVWLMETALALGSKIYGGKKVVMVFDRRGYSKKNMSPNGTGVMKEVLRMLQDYYPETLERFYIIGLDWFFRFIYAIARPFLSEKTRNKIQVSDGIDILQKNFTKENLIKEYGGTYDFKYDPVSVFNRVEILQKERFGSTNKNMIQMETSNYRAEPSSNKDSREKEIVTSKINNNEVEESRGKVDDSCEVHLVGEEYSLVSVAWKKYENSITLYKFPKFNVKPERTVFIK